MNIKLISTALSMIILAIFGTAASSIGIECANSNGGQYANNKRTNFNFLIFNLICNILMILIGFGSIFLATQTPV